MRGFLLLCVCLPLAGCLVGASQGRSSTSVVRDTGVPGIDRTTVTSEQSGSYVGGGMPMMVGGGYGYGYGGGYTVVTGPSCAIHPDSCAVIQRTTVVQPVTVVSNGGGERGSVAAGSGGDPELDAFLKKHEKAIAYLVGQNGQSVRQTCQILTANPEAIKDPAERKEVIDACEAYLAKHPYNPSKEEK